MSSLSSWRPPDLLQGVLGRLVPHQMRGLQVSRRVIWHAPRVNRTVDAASLSQPPKYRSDVHFSLLQRESGSERHDLPIWVSAPGAMQYEPESWGPILRTDVPGVPGAFVLSNVLTPHECDQMRTLSEAMGYTTDAPVSLGRHIRRNENCVWIADDTLWKPIWTRVARHMPAEVAGGRPAGLNQRMRLYKYGVEDIFRLHTDGSWAGSAVDTRGKLVRDSYGDRWSQLTFLIYLDDDYDGGETTFWVPDAAHSSSGEMHSVSVPLGGVLCFFHGEHPLSPLHEGSLVTRGIKRIVRSDVLYTYPHVDTASSQCDEAVEAGKSPYSGLASGARVRLDGLQTAVEHNGKLGTLVSMQISPMGERWAVRLDGEVAGNSEVSSDAPHSLISGDLIWVRPGHLHAIE
jgi:hypothetical protein